MCPCVWPPPPPSQSVWYLDAVPVEEARQGETFLLIQELAEDDHLLEEEDPPLAHPAERTALRVRHHERVLQQEAALSHDLPRREGAMDTCFWGNEEGNAACTMCRRSDFLHQIPEAGRRSSCRCTFLARCT